MFGTINHSAITANDNHVGVAWAQDTQPTGLVAADVGKLWLDTNATDGALYICTDDSPETFERFGRKPIILKSIYVEAPETDDQFVLFRAASDMTVLSVSAVCIGSTPSVEYTVYHGASLASGTQVATDTVTSVTTGEAASSIDDAGIDDNDWVWIEVDAASGTITGVNITIEMTEDDA
jgi:hypothetical protein